MITLKRTKVVEATPQEIFDMLADPQELTKLIPRVQRVDVLERHSDRARIATHMGLGGAFGTIRCEGELRWVEGESLSFTVHKPLPIDDLLDRAAQRGILRYRRYHGRSHFVIYRSGTGTDPAPPLLKARSRVERRWGGRPTVARLLP